MIRGEKIACDFIEGVCKERSELKIVLERSRDYRRLIQINSDTLALYAAHHNTHKTLGGFDIYSWNHDCGFWGNEITLMGMPVDGVWHIVAAYSSPGTAYCPKGYGYLGGTQYGNVRLGYIQEDHHQALLDHLSEVMPIETQGVAIINDAVLDRVQVG